MQNVIRGATATIGVFLVIFATVLAHIGINNVSFDTGALITFMMLFTGIICVAIAGKQ